MMNPSLQSWRFSCLSFRLSEAALSFDIAKRTIMEEVSCRSGLKTAQTEKLSLALSLLLRKF